MYTALKCVDSDYVIYIYTYSSYGDIHVSLYESFGVCDTSGVRERLWSQW